MPQASDELRVYWGGVDPQPPMAYLKSHGFERTPEWRWLAPKGITWELMSDKEQKAVDFLCDEWDFAGVVGNP